MFRAIPILGPWISGRIAESAGERVVESALGALITSIFFTQDAGRIATGDREVQER